jgi:hypothetical protein
VSKDKGEELKVESTPYIEKDFNCARDATNFFNNFGLIYSKGDCKPVVDRLNFCAGFIRMVNSASTPFGGSSIEEVKLEILITEFLETYNGQNFLFQSHLDKIMGILESSDISVIKIESFYDVLN